MDTVFFGVRNKPNPGVVFGNHLLNVLQWHIFIEFEHKRLTMTAHGTDTNTNRIDRNGWLIKTRAATQNFVGLGTPLPLFKARTIPAVGINPWNEAAGKRNQKVLGLLGREALLGC